MSIKQCAAGFLAGVSLCLLPITGCSADSASDTDSDTYGKEADTVDHAVTTNGCRDGYPDYQRIHTGLGVSSVPANDGAYDISQYCLNEINIRRRTDNHPFKTTTLRNYHDAYSALLPNFARMGIDTTPDKNDASQTCPWCQSVANAKAGGHSGYGICGGQGATAAYCGVGNNATIKDAVKGCLDMIENEKGFSGHQGGLLWDTSRPVSCVLGVITASGAKKKGISINWGPPTITDYSRPNGARCKRAKHCASGTCTDGRCKGRGGETCPTNDNIDCSLHAGDDPGICVRKNAACASGNCSSGKCR
jgi:hypothetical protein